MMRRPVLIWTACLPFILFFAALFAVKAAEPEQQATPTPQSACIPGLQKWADPTSLLLGDDTHVTLVVTGTCPIQEAPIDLVILTDMSNSMGKLSLGPGVQTPTERALPSPTGGTREPPPTAPIGEATPARGGEPPFCNPPRVEPTATNTPRWPPRRTPTPAIPPTPDVNDLEPPCDRDWVREEQQWLGDFLSSDQVNRDLASDRLRIGFVGFNDRAGISVNLTSEKGKVTTGIGRLRSGEVTRINNGMREAIRVLDGTGSRPDESRIKAILILSDFQFCAKDMRVTPDKGTLVISVGFGVRDYDMRKLSDLATDSRFVVDRHQLQEVMDIYDTDMSAGHPVSMTSLKVTDELTDTMTLMPGSVMPPTVTITGQLLEWDFAPPSFPVTLTYDVQPLESGHQPISKQADASWVDSEGLPGSGSFPPVSVDVMVHSPTPTSTPTSTSTPTATATDTPTATPEPLARYLPMLYNSWPPPTPTPIAPPTPTKCIPEVQTVDVALVMDTSTSMNDPTQQGGVPKLQAAIDAASALVDLLKADDQVTVVAFNAEATVLAQLTSDKNAVKAALRRLPETQHTGTWIDRGLDAAFGELTGPLHKSKNHRSIILVTDGEHMGTGGPAEVIAVADKIKDEGISIVTIGLGGDVGEALLREVASQPTYYFKAPNAEDLLALYRQIAQFIPCP